MTFGMHESHELSDLSEDYREWSVVNEKLPSPEGALKTLDLNITQTSQSQPVPQLPEVPSPSWYPIHQAGIPARFCDSTLRNELWITKADARTYFGLNDAYFGILNEWPGRIKLGRGKYWVSQVWDAVEFHAGMEVAEEALRAFKAKTVQKER